MKTTLIALCAFVALHPAFAQEKRTPSTNSPPVRSGEKAKTAVPKSHKQTKTRNATGRVASAKAKPRKAAKATPPKPRHPWIGHTVTISPSERDTIRAYVRNRIDGSKLGKPNGVPQGLARKVAWFNTLPPGWQKTCVPGKVLAPEVHKHCQPLPYDLTAKLPPPPPGTVLLAVDARVVRVGYPTYEILDTFDVLAPPAELMGAYPARPAAQRLAAVTVRSTR